MRKINVTAQDDAITISLRNVSFGEVAAQVFEDGGNTYVLEAGLDYDPASVTDWIGVKMTDITSKTDIDSYAAVTGGAYADLSAFGSVRFRCSAFVAAGVIGLNAR